MATFDDIKSYYVNILQREPSDDEVNSWAAPVNSGVLTIEQVKAAFINSPEAETVHAVTRLYQSAFGRVPDPEGLKTWVSSGKSMDEIADGFAGSDEFIGRYGSNKPTEGFITSLYYQVLGRAPDADGMKSWMASGLSAAQMLVGFSESKEFKEKTASATYVFLDNIAKGEETYSGGLFDRMPAQPEVVGQTFTLAAGADNVTGTANNDTINALTVKADGAPASTLTAFDSIDGAGGNDTLNIYSDGTLNPKLSGSETIKNVETINIFNSTAAFGATGGIDASKFVGATTINQNGLAAAVTNLASTTTAGFKNVATAAGPAALSVTAAAAATSANVALDGVKGTDANANSAFDAGDNTAHLIVAGAALNAVTVSGSLAQALVSTDPAAAANLVLGVIAGKDVQTLSVNTDVATILAIAEGADSTKEITTVDASASKGGVTYAGTVASGTVAPATIKTGSGDDTVAIVAATVKDDAATTAVDETVSALLETGAGKDTIIINTSGTGTTTANAGDGNDKVTLNADGSGKLTVNLGAGSDTFTVSGAGAVSSTDMIDGGEGSDSLLLKIVGSANIGAFQNFEVFDAAGLAKTLDVNILATKNTVTEITASGDVGTSAILNNLGAGVGYRVTGDTTVTNALSLTQKTAGTLTVTLDIDETNTTAVDSGAKTSVDAGVVASNATSIKAVFDSAFVGEALDASDNLTNLTMTGTKATSLEVVSGGANAFNDLVYTGGNDATTGKGDLLTSVTVTGDRDFSFSYAAADGSEIASFDASGLTGKLTFSTAALKVESAANKFDGGVVKLGSGDDVITIGQGASISGIEKGTAEGAAAQSAFDVLTTGAAVAQAADVASTGTLNIKDGLLTFEGAGPATLADAITLVDTQLTTGGDAVVFEYIDNSYVFVDGGPVVELVGVTGLKGLAEVGTTDKLYLI